MKLHTTNIEIPGKTFICGEYLSLHGGLTCTVLTKPHFVVEFKERKPGADNTNLNTFHPFSPAGKFLEENKTEFNNINISFQDPHLGAGGMGASTAQFLGLYLFKNKIKNLDEVDRENLLYEYQKYSSSTSGISPSGADLVSQTFSKFTFYSRNENLIEELDWVFSDISFLVFRTGFKVATHEHLQHLSTFDSSNLLTISNKNFDSFKTKNSEKFIESINAYSRELDRLGFVHQMTLELMEEIQKELPMIKAIKGCGALGADTVLIVAKNEDIRHVQGALTEMDLQVIVNPMKLSTGIIIKGN